MSKNPENGQTALLNPSAGRSLDTGRPPADALSYFFQLSFDMLVVAGQDGYFKYVNEAFQEKLGWSFAELSGRPFLDFVHPDDLPAAQQVVAKLISGRPAEKFVVRLLRNTEDYLWLEWNASAAPTGDLYGIARDITTELQEREESLAAILSVTERLYQVSASLTGITTVEELLQDVILPNVGAGAHAVTVMAIEEDADGNPEWLEMIALWSASNNAAFPVGSRFYLPDIPSVDWYDLPNQPQIIPDVGAVAEHLDPTTRQFYQQNNVQSNVALPLQSAEQWEGLITVSWPFPQNFTDGDRRVFESLARQAALTMQNLRRVQEMQQQTTALQETTAFLDTVIDNIPAGLFVKDAQELRFLRWNKGNEAIVGLKQEEVLGKNDWDLFPAEQAEYFQAKDREILESGQPHDIPEEVVENPHQGPRWLHTRKVPILDMDGQSKYLLGISEDITDQRQATARELEIEHLYRQAIEAAGAVAYALDYKTDTYTFMSSGIEAMTGYSREKITPAIWRSLHVETTLGDIAGGYTLEEARHLARAGEIQRWQGDYLINTRDGDRRWITNTAVIGVDEQGSPRSIGILIDITERKSTEATLARQAADYQETTDFLDAVVDNLPLMLFVKEAEELRFVRWNLGAEEITGYDETTMLGKNDYDFFPPEEADHFVNHDRQVLESGQPLDIPVEPIETKDQGKRLLFTRKVPIYDETGRPKYLLGISEDITEQERVRAEREALEERYRQAIEAAGAVAYSLDYTTDTYTFIGEGIQEMTGYSAAEITPNLWRSLHRETILGEEAAGMTLEEARRMARTGRLQRWQGDYRIDTRSGQSRWITNAAVILVDETEDTARSIGILIDITERKEAEQALAQQAAELRALNRRLTRQGWDDFLVAEPAEVQFAFDLPAEETPAGVELEGNGLLAQPLAVRGEPIGQLTVNEPQKFPEEAAVIMAEVAERLSAHLENLRLTRQTEEALADSERRARYQTNVALAVASLTERGLAAVPDVLRLLGEAIQVSSVFYTQAGEDDQGAYWRLAAEWCAPGVQSVKDDPIMQRMDVDMLPSWRETLLKKGLLNSADPDFPEEIRQILHMRNIRSILIISVPGNHATPDYLGFNEESRQREWRDDEISALRTAAAALASTIQRDSLYNQVQNALTRTEDQAQRLAYLSIFGAALNATTQLQEIFDLLAAQAGGIVPHDRLSLALLNRSRVTLDLYAVPEKEEAYRLDQTVPLEDTLVGEVVNTGRLKHIDDLSTGDYGDVHFLREDGIQEIISAPLVAGGLTLGAISFGRRTIPSFDEQDENLVQQIASLMATSIESQRLLAQAQARAERERQVRAAVDRVRRASDQEGILQVAREELGRMLGAKQAVVQLHDSEEDQAGRPIPETLLPAGEE